MSDPNVHVANHPSGHPNKTAVNPDNPIFGRPADPIPAVSLQQAALVQSEKNPRETVISPLLNDPTAADLDAIAAENAAKEATSQAEQAGSGSERNGSKADDWTQTTGAGLTDDTSSADTGAEYTHGSGEGSSKITPVVPVDLPTQEEADAIVAQAKAEEDKRKAESAIVDHFKVGDKVRFTPESGNDTTEVFTIDGGERGDNADGTWFWRLVERPGELFLEQNLTPADPNEA